MQGATRFVSSLRYRDWRYLWIGLMTSQTGEWMDNIAINWLVYVQTGSPLALGTTQLARGLPNIFFSLVGGVIADRVDRRTLMIWTQLGNLVCTIVLAGLATAGSLDLPVLFVLLIVRGSVGAFFGPARGSVIGDLVPRSEIPNAVVLHSAVFNSTRMVGPAIAGILIAIIGSAFVLWINAASLAVCVLMLILMRVPPRAAAAMLSAWGSFVEGIRYVRRQPVVLMLLLLGIGPFILGQPYQSMMPVFARDVLQVGPQGLGLLTTAAATGSLVGAFVMTAFGDFSGKGRAMLLGLMAYGSLIAAFALSPWPIVSGLVLFLVGCSFQIYATTNSTLVQLIVPSEYRGRVLGIHQTDRGFIPLGSMLMGSIAQVAGAPFAVALMGGSLVIAALAVLAAVPRMRRLE
ncbi:MAG TPA: MFS transporter [Chloroflexota bacterium]